MIPIVSIVGKSGSGKTTLLEQVIGRLTGKGHRVGTIKHDAHDFEIDYEGKDSWRHKQAGASTVVLASRNKVAVVKDVKKEWSLERLALAFADDHDIIITEGFKQSPFPKIEVIRKACSLKPLCSKDKTLIAIATDIKARGKLPRFDINDIEGIADFIEERFLHPPHRPPHGGSATLVVDGKVVTLKPFIETLLKESLRGIIKSLKGCANPREIEVKIKK